MANTERLMVFSVKLLKLLKNILKVKIGLKFAFIFTKDNVSAHGKTIKQAYRDWLFKTLR